MRDANLAGRHAPKPNNDLNIDAQPTVSKFMAFKTLLFLINHSFHPISQAFLITCLTVHCSQVDIDLCFLLLPLLCHYSSFIYFCLSALHYSSSSHSAQAPNPVHCRPGGEGVHQPVFQVHTGLMEDAKSRSYRPRWSRSGERSAPAVLEVL